MKNIGQLIKSAHNALNNDINRFASQYDLTGTQMSVIDFIARHNHHQVSQRAIEEEFNIRRSTTTTILQRMSKRQLITRSSSNTDRRQKIVQLSPQGEKMVPIVQRYIEEHDHQLLANYSEQEIAQFRQMLIEISEENYGGKD